MWNTIIPPSFPKTGSMRSRPQLLLLLGCAKYAYLTKALLSPLQAGGCSKREWGAKDSSPRRSRRCNRSRSRRSSSCFSYDRCSDNHHHQQQVQWMDQPRRGRQRVSSLIRRAQSRRGRTGGTDPGKQPLLLLARGGSSSSPVVLSSVASIEVAPAGGEASAEGKSLPWWRSIHDRDIALLALPSLLSLLVDPMLSLVDTYFVGRLGAIQLASLGPCTSTFHMVFNSFRAMTQSTTSLVSSSLAVGDKERAGEISQASLLLASMLGLVLMGLLLTTGPAILSLMGAPNRGATALLHGHGLRYLNVRALAAPAVLLIMVCEGTFRGYGNTRVSAKVSASAALLNGLLDPLLMFTLGLGMAGAAGATAAAQYMAVALYLARLVKGVRTGEMRLPLLESMWQRRKDGKAAKIAAAAVGGDTVAVDDTMAVGDTVARTVAETDAVPIPSAWDTLRKSVREMRPLLRVILGANAAMLLRTTSLMFCWAVATSVATRMGPAEVGAHQVALSLWLLLALVAEAPSIATQVLGARYLGRGELPEARAMCRRAAGLTLVSSVALGSVLWASKSLIPPVFTSDPSQLARLGKLLPILAVQQPLVACTLVCEGMLVGAKQFRWLGVGTLVATSLSTGVLMFVHRRPSLGIEGVWGAITVMFCGRLLSALTRLLDRKRGPYWKDCQQKQQ